MKIAIGGDHAGFTYKEAVVALLKDKGVAVEDFGPFSEESVDYPDFVHPVAKKVDAKEADLGILICGSGNGVAMTANKYQSVRAALCWQTELAALARQHNNANVLCIPARFVDLALAKGMVETFLNESFEGGRHERRVNKISC
ncbi:ribose 5-phosphate isomerase B [uncultured Microscilla sp.]|uniref:ribose 5-phosphate isomerase B n=1 Tax=uncultured Microscilla sp. TaxID=432653 RepID=UPI0026316FD7|nr:ribose 5-phosphate isomerase B [uncultured Microscilla sp.]